MRCARILALLVLALPVLLPQAAGAAPRTPSSDGEVLEKLPFRAADATGRDLPPLRVRVLISQGAPVPALSLARRYFDLASAEGDPRYIGYAEALLRPWISQADPPAEVLF